MKKQRAKRANGFTLVEAIVAGIISVIIAAVAITVFMMHNRQLRESIAMGKLQRQYDNIAEEIAFDVRMANRVLGLLPDIDPVPTDFTAFPVPLPLAPNAKMIQMYDNSGAIIAGYDISSGTLREWINGSIWQDYEVGGGVVELDEASSNFSLPIYRNEVEVRLSLKTVVNQSTYYLQPRKDAFKCRNSPY